MNGSEKSPKAGGGAVAAAGENAIATERFDEILLRLRGVVNKLETGNLPLEDSLKFFEEGIDLCRKGASLLDSAERKVEARRYSLLAPGKRLRPVLALAAAEAAGDFRDAGVLVAASTVELVHCYSLIHDDLPAMDDDDFRRGKPSNHKVFGEAMAILAGDGLLTLAFEWLADAGQRSGRPAAFGRAAPAPTSFEPLERLHAEKTGALFRAAVEIGAHASGASPEDAAARN